ncbi:MAG: hypothetical protein U0X20_17275 [Caldilineaceae bacterium]
MPDSTTLEAVTAQLALRLRERTEVAGSAENYIIVMTKRPNWRYVNVSCLGKTPTSTALQRIAHTLLLPTNHRWTVSSEPVQNNKRIYIATYSTQTPIEWSVDEQRISLTPIQELDPTNPPPPPDPGVDDTQEMATVGV